MASKGPKSDISTPVAKPVAKAAAKPVATAKPVVPFVSAEAAAATTPALIVPAEPVAAAPAPVVPAEPVAAAVAPTPAPVTTEATPAPAPAVAILKKEVTTMENTIKSAAENVQAQAKSMFGDVNDRAKTAMEKGSKMFEDMNEFSKGNVEALVESSKIAAKGAEEIAKYTTEYVKASVEKANAAAKQFAAVKSPTELFALQSEHAKSAMDTVMAETAKFTENYLKLLGEIAQPISNRVAVAAEKMKIAA